jgi:hypothetical protein
MGFVTIHQLNAPVLRDWIFPDHIVMTELRSILFKPELSHGGSFSPLGFLTAQRLHKRGEEGRSNT